MGFHLLGSDRIGSDRIGSDRIGSDRIYDTRMRSVENFLIQIDPERIEKKVKIFLTFFRSTQDQTDRIAFSSNKNQCLDHVISISEIHQGSWEIVYS